MKKFYTLLFALLAVTQVALAQSGSVRGRVLGSDTREPLTGVTVLLEGTTKGASTNAAGEFNIMDVPTGTYNLRISYVGYTFPRQSVTVTSGGTTDIGTVT